MTDPTSKFEEEAKKAITTERMSDVWWKMYTFLVVGIQAQPVDGKYPFLYTLARLKLDMKYQTMRSPEAMQERPWQFPNITTYQMYATNVTTPEEHLQLDSEGRPIPHRAPAARPDIEPEQFVQKVRRTPGEWFSEVSSKTPAERIRDPESATGGYPLNAKWYRQGRALIYRQPTGKFYTEEEYPSKELGIARITQTIRDIIWTLKLDPKGKHLPYDNISAEDVHNQIITRLREASAYRKRIMAEFEDLTSGFLDYKVAIVDPAGFSGIYDSIEEAMLAAERQATEEFLQEEEPMRAAASLSKEDAKILVEAANILDTKAPAVANQIDAILRAPLVEEVSFKKADFVAALVRVANRLDAAGETELAAQADSLLKSLETAKDL